LNGRRQFDGKDFIVDGDTLILASGALANSDIVVVTEFTESIVPEAIAFRIFQDMRGVQATYRITPSTTTTLVQNLSSLADIAYVRDATALTQPNLPDGIFGVCTIGGERIMYRERDTALNTISGLMRGTGGTAATSHTVGTEVYDIGRGNLMFEEYQDYFVKNNFDAVGINNPDRTPGQTVFTATNIQLEDFGEDSAIFVDGIEIYVGGIKQYPFNTVDCQYPYLIDVVPAIVNEEEVHVPQVEFVVSSTVYPALVAPPDSEEITILVRRGKTWYQGGVVFNPDTQLIQQQPSNGVALQETNTRAARFFQGI
jgi:hypothetical protein